KIKIRITATASYIIMAYSGVCTSTINLTELTCIVYSTADSIKESTLQSLTPGTTLLLRVARYPSLVIPSGSLSMCISEILNIPAVDNTNRVGIGIANPFAKLDVAGTVIVRDSLLVAKNIETRANLKANTLNTNTLTANTLTANSLTTTTLAANTLQLTGELIGGIHSIGEVYGGGIVFFATPNGLHGLIAETQDQSTSSSWYDAQDLISTNSTHTTAGKLFTDWRLPTKNELNLLYQQKSVVGGFANNSFYWSSSEYIPDSAWGQDFNVGFQTNNFKSYPDNVRAVRAF
ncbi:MAG: DUF1566 domain-containing protein, partial [Ferruginibacter sp.]